MKNCFIPNQFYLQQHFNYDPEIGIFSRKIKTSNRTVIGKPLLAGSKHRRILISIQNKVYKAHHLAWVYVYGEWPDEIDHINNDPLDNRISNLRLATRQQNNYNKRHAHKSGSGIKGVTWDKFRKKWFVKIGANKKQIALGRYDNLEEAAKVITEARNKYHEEFANFN
jgi:hypothetical protein